MKAAPQNIVGDWEDRAKAEVFTGNGEMAVLMRACDWVSTTLGPVAAWPQSLRTTVDICLNSRFPIVIFWGSEFLILYNDAYRPLLGDKYPAALGQPCRTVWPEIWATVSLRLQQVLTTGQATWEEDFLLVTQRYGRTEESSFTFSYSPIRDETGKIAGVFCPVAETTQKALAEQELRESEERLRLATESARVGLWDWDLLTGRVIWAENFERLYGLAPGTFGDTYEHFFSFVHPADRERVNAATTRIRTEGADYDVEFRIIRPDGTIVWALSKGQILYDASDRPVRMVGALLDITDRKCAEEALQGNEKRYRALFEHSSDAVALFGVDGVILYGSPSTRQVLGYALKEFVGRSAFDLIHPKDHDFVQQQVLEAARQPGISVPVQARVLHKDGSWRWLEGTFTNLLAEPSVQAIVNNYRDVTTRKQAEERLRHLTEELRRSNADLEQFAYVASHDLQAPLRKLANFIQLFARRYRGTLDVQADELIGHVVEGVKRMRELIEDLLTYGQAGAPELEFAQTDCEAGLKRVLDTLQPQIHDVGAVVTHDPLPIVWGAERQLEQVFQNLLSNALKFRGAEPPRIHISARCEGSTWVFTVRDNGIGIDSQYAERLFVLFRRLHSQREYPGTGIGLAICKKVIERHGGRIWVESTLGHGATFFFTISHVRGSKE